MNVLVGAGPYLGISTLGAGLGGALMVAAHCSRLETWCPEDNQASELGSLRVAHGAKEVPEALSNRNGEGAIAISPSRTRSSYIEHGV